MGNESIFRRFKVTCGEEEKKALLDLISKKGLTRQDLTLILKSMRINPDMGQSCD